MFAGFWKRCAALIIDTVIFYVIALTFMMLSGYNPYNYSPAAQDFKALLIAVSGSMIIYILYWTLFECSPLQATPGKMALGIKVTDINGNRVSFGRSLSRNLGKIVSNLTLNIGYAMAGFTVRKQALHDKMADCLVIDKNATAQDLQPLPKAKAWLVVLAILGALSPVILSIIMSIAMFALVAAYMGGSFQPLNEENAVQNSEYYEAEMAGNLLTLISMFQNLYAQQHGGQYATTFEELQNAIPGFPDQGYEAGDYKLELMPDYIMAVYPGNDEIPAHTITNCYAAEKVCLYSADADFAKGSGMAYEEPGKCCLNLE